MPEQDGTLKFLDPQLVAKLSNMNLVSRVVAEGFITGLHRSPHKGFSVEFAEHRQYVPGDDPRFLDWTVYAKTDHYFIKEYEEETNLKAYLLLDASASMGYGSGNLTKLEYACYLAAGLAYLMVKQRDSVGLVTFADRIRKHLPPKSKASHLRLILDELADLSPGGETKISKTFHDLAENIKRRGLIIAISDLLDTPKDVLTSLQHFRHRKHDVIVFHVLDKDEIEFPFGSYATFQDLETGQRLQVDPGFFRKQYQRKMQELLETYKRGCFESRIDYVQVDTSVPYDHTLTSYLSRRARTS